MGTMHYSCVIPEDQITWILPFDGHDKLILAGMFQKSTYQLCTFLLIYTLNVMHVIAYIDYRSSGSFMNLEDSMPRKISLVWVKMGKKVGSCFSTGVEKGVVTDIIVFF
jgi:hypothetical protein